MRTEELNMVWPTIIKYEYFQLRKKQEPQDGRFSFCDLL